MKYFQPKWKRYIGEVFSEPLPKWLDFTALFLAFLAGWYANSKFPIAYAPFKQALSDSRQTKVMIIDSGIDSAYLDHPKLCLDGHWDFSTGSSEIPLDDDFDGNHGTKVATIILDEALNNDYCLIIVRIAARFGDDFVWSVAKSLEYAKLLNVDVVNLSYNFRFPDPMLYASLQEVTKSGVRVFVAAGNHGKNLEVYCNRKNRYFIYPQCFNGLNENFILVGALDENDKMAVYSNRGKRVKLWYSGHTSSFGFGEGTSFATPRAIAHYLTNLTERNQDESSTDN